MIGGGPSSSELIVEEEDDALSPGDEVGEYIVEAKLATGGMGTVYSARHPLIGKKAAIKVISRALTGNPGAVARFAQEARAVNQIGHPNIVDIFSFGQLPSGPHYFIMEWLQGENLGDLLERGPIDPVDALSLLEPICDALAAAHASNIVHRDLKPENIFIAAVREQRRLVKLLDFGIAKLSATTSDSSPTRTGMVMGTPGYISPEQARGQHVDARTDIYALGVLMFQMFAGRLPFEGPSSMDIVSMHLHQDPPRISSVWPNVPPVLDDLVLRMMAKAADARPLLAEVRSVLAAQIAELSGLTSLPTHRRLSTAPISRPPSTIGGSALQDTQPENAAPAAPARSRRKLAPIIAVFAVFGVLGAAGLAFVMARGQEAAPEPGPRQEAPVAATEKAPPPGNTEAAPAAVELDAGIPDAGMPDAAATLTKTATDEPSKASKRKKTRKKRRKPPKTDEKKKPKSRNDLDYMLDPFGKK